LASEFDVVAAVHNGQEALDAAAQLDPEVVLDISMPVLDGIKAAARLTQNNASAKIVFLTANQDALMCQAVCETGALSYVTKLGLRLDLVHATRLALAGRRFVSPEVGGVPTRSVVARLRLNNYAIERRCGYEAPPHHADQPKGIT
jgi:DNA-binding NarL/FixJ family response regulator